ncbi:hypothetical protein SDC9_132056 [bioreactor metagenome]|uniref:Uncharacterized protein n=1 Tax=bioreactor metagenome TaxID=1076179 RepID=A0A645D6Y5_9ZZZZ
MSAQAHDAGARVIRRAELGKFRAAHRYNVLHRTQRLHVVYDGRAHVKAQHRRKEWRLDAGIGALAFKRFDQPGFLTANVGPCPTVHVDLKLIAAPGNVLSQKTLCTRFIKRPVQDARAFDKLASNVNVGQVDVIGVAGNDHSLDQLVRIFVNDLFVFKSAGLRFIGIANEVNWFATAPIHKGPLQAAREARAAAAAQPRNFDFVAQLLSAGDTFAVRQGFRCQREGLAQHVVSAMAHVTLDVRRIPRLINVFQDESIFLRH